jgi:hypothetical protein
VIFFWQIFKKKKGNVGPQKKIPKYFTQNDEILLQKKNPKHGFLKIYSPLLYKEIF